MSLRTLIETTTRYHLVADDGERDLASIEVMQIRDALAQRERIAVVVSPDDDDVNVTFEVRPR